MLSEPKIVERTAQSYACVRRIVGMNDITKVADKMTGEFFARLSQLGVAPAGAPFFKYNRFDGQGQIELEWGAPVPANAQGDDLVKMGTLPAGRYVSAMHTGPFGGLRDATAKVLDWVGENGLELDQQTTHNGESFGCRLETYFTDPRAEPDSRKWQTEISMRLADET